MQIEQQLRQLIAWHKAKKKWTGGYDYFSPRGSYRDKLTDTMIWNPMGLPPAVSAGKAVLSVFRSPLLLERLCNADLLTPIEDCKTAPFFHVRDVCLALAALMRGVKPPRLPKEQPLKPGELEIGPALTQWRYVKTAQAAEMLGISARTLTYHAEQGTVPCLRLGKHRLFSIAEVVAYLRKSTERKRLRPADIAAILR